jgi:uncharacterized metal-binding protein YceD (DUF177 family)
MTSAPEFSRPFDITKLGKQGQRQTIEATPGELKALARRMKIPAIHSLCATLDIQPWKKGQIRVRGKLQASIDQECVRTLDIFTSSMEEPVERIYARRSRQDAPEQNKENEIDPLASDEPDIIEGDRIDLGELVAETLALSLDPWPKKPGTDFIDYQTDDSGAAPVEERRPSPFAGLESLKQKK